MTVVVVVESSPHQEGTEHEEADKIGNGKIATTGKLLSRAEVRLRVTPIPRKASKHYLLPCLTGGTPGDHTGVPSWMRGNEVMVSGIVEAGWVKMTHFLIGATSGTDSILIFKKLACHAYDSHVCILQMEH